jgi:hypothetical protein
MKRLFLSLLFIVEMISVNKLAAQTGVAINTDGSVADGSAMLDVKATNKGVLIPRIALTSSVTTPVIGLLVYQTGGTAGFYYYNGAAWIFIQNSGNANVTLQGNAFNGASQLVQMTAATKLPAVDGSLLTNLNASALASGTVPTARLGSGTASSSTFLKGDNTWAAASGGGGGCNYFSNMPNSVTATVIFYSISAGNSGNATFQNNAQPMAAACTFDAIYLSTYVSAGAGPVDAITLTLYVNNVATALAVTVTPSTSLNVVVKGGSTSASVAVSAGDLVAFGVTQSNTAPTVQMKMAVHAL